MTKLSLADLYDDLCTSEKVLYDCQTQDLELFAKFVDHYENVVTAKKSESKRLKDAESKIFHLEQKVFLF